MVVERGTLVDSFSVPQARAIPVDSRPMTRIATLRDELLHYVPADSLEVAHLAAIVALLEAADAGFTRSHFVPGHFTASLFILDPAGEHLLLHHHRRLDRWLQMGGHIEEGEAPADAALREGREESGLTDLALLRPGVFDLDVHAIPAGKGEPDHLHHDIRYVANTAMPDRLALDPGESVALRWVPLGEAEALMKEAASTRVIRKLAEMRVSHGGI